MGDGTDAQERREEIERAVRARCDAGDYAAATEAAIRGYGPEVYGFLVAVLRDGGAAEEAFSIFIVDLWRGLPRFGWQSSLRTWLYVLARHAGARYRRGGRRNEVPLDGSEAVSGIAAAVRTATQSWLRTEKKEGLAALRAALSDEDQALLVLRIDRGLEWQEIARTFLYVPGLDEPGVDEPGVDEPGPDEDALRREAARLRKRFERLRAELVEAGRKAGLIRD